jgi:hypothetical protein
MSGNWAEKEQRLVKLPEDDPEIFAIYFNLVYTNRTATILSAVSPRERKEIGAEFDLLAKLYVLAEKLQDKNAKNTIVKALKATSLESDSAGNSYLPGWKTILIIYAGTTSGSLARESLVGLYAMENLGLVNLVKDADKVPKVFLIDMAVAFQLESEDFPLMPIIRSPIWRRRTDVFGQRARC